jgi:pimeloyl-ACP methyl ester carboxylesterase
VKIDAMPYASNLGVKIHYEVEGSGPPLVLAHGLGYSGEDWRDFGYVDLMRHDFQLILVDHRGHGRSDKPHDPTAYSPELRVHDHVAVLDELGIRQAHFWGYSMGGAVAFMIGKWAPDRFRSLVIGGEDPYPPSKVPAGHSIPQHKRVQGLPDAPNPILELMKQGGDAWVRHREANMDLTPEMKARYRENDFEALLALRQTPYRWGEQIVPILPHFPIPSLLYGGEAEDVFLTMKEAASAMPAATFVSLPEYSHVDIWVKSGEIVPHVRRSLEMHPIA